MSLALTALVAADDRAHGAEDVPAAAVVASYRATRYDTFNPNNQYALDSPRLAVTAGYLSDPANFGSAGAFGRAVTLRSDIDVASAETLAGVDVFFAGLLHDDDYAPGEIAALQDFVDAGGALILTADLPSHSVTEAFGIPSDCGAQAGTTAPVVGHVDALSAHPIADGPFGASGPTFEQWFNVGCLLPPLGSSASVVASNEAPGYEGAAIVVVERGARTPGSGPVIMLSDTDLFTTYASTDISMNAATVNGTLIKNLFAFAIEETPSVTVDVPAATVEGQPTGISATVLDDDVTSTLWTAAAGSGVDAGASCAFADATAVATTVTCDDDGSWTLTLTVTDGLTPVADGGVMAVTNAAPSVVLTAPAAGSTYAPGDVVAVAGDVADDGSNDAVECTFDWGDGEPSETVAVTGGTCSATHAYTAVGSYTVSVTATDDDGGSSAAAQQAIDVAEDPGPTYAFRGFFAPIDNDEVNRMKSGATVPVKFQVRDETGALVTSTSVVSSASGVRVPCDGGAGVDPLEEYAAGNTSLRYDAGSQQFVYNWKAPAGKAGACYEIVIALVDGSEYAASFLLR